MASISEDWLCVPLFKGLKSSQGKWDDVTMRISELLERSAEFEPYDIGIRPDLSGLVVLDADVVRKRSTNISPSERACGTKFLEYYEDGTQELLAWAAAHKLEIPPTLMVRSAGRPDGSHLPGWHLYYKQCPDWKIAKDLSLTPHCQVKAGKGIVRFSPHYEILRDLPVIELPEDWAQAIQSFEPPKISSWRGAAATAAADGDWASRAGGLNDLYTKIKGAWLKMGLGTETEVNDALLAFNDAIADPMDKDRLNSTVLRNKGW